MIKSSIEHLKDADESYFTHMKIALKVSFLLFYASFMALIHSLIPGIFKTGASSSIKNLYSMINERN